MGSEGAKLVYCVVDGQTRHVSEFAQLAPKDRPAALCPECSTRIVMKLGSSGRRAHHVAHKPESICIVAKPESALHLNSKIHVYQQLLQGRALYVSQACTGWTVPKRGIYGGGQRRCSSEGVRPYLWLENWDQVEMEKHIGSRKPDIVFYRNGAAVAAIEIFATHAVDEEKKADLKALGIPWLEVNAIDIYEPDEFEFTEPWSISQPLRHVNSDPPIPLWTCDKCLEGPTRHLSRVHAQEEARAEAEAAEAIAAASRRGEVRKYAGPENRIVKAKAVCLFRDDGLYEKHELLIFQRTESYPSDEIASLYLRDGKSGRILAEENAPITDESRTNISTAYKAWRGLFGSSYHIEDITRWVPYEEMTSLLHQWKSPYLYDERKQQWVERTAK